MSYERGWDALNLRMPATIPHTEYCSHPELVQAITGLDPRVKKQSDAAWRVFYQMTDYDLLWFNNDGPEWQGRVTSMGHAEFEEGGTDYDPTIYCPFKDPEEVLSFDPVKEFGLPDIKARTKYFEEIHQKKQKDNPTMVVPGGYYKTLFSACIHVFGWEMFLSAAPLDYQSFGRVLDGFFEISLANFKAWAATNIKVFICHDDIVWTSGAVFHPNWYRKYIFPKYHQLWKILHEKDIIVLYCADGNYTQFIDDIVSAGADGFIFEPGTNLKYIVGKYGQTKVIIGNIDTRILTFGSKEDITAEVKRCYESAKNCPGYFFAVGNHIPHNVPIANALHYLNLIKKRKR